MRFLTLLSTLCLFAFGVVPAAQAQDDDQWRWALRINGWLPEIQGTTRGGDDFEITLDDIFDNLDKLDLAMLATVEGERGRWGGFTDLVYSALSGSESRQRSAAGLPIEGTLKAEVEVDAWIVTAAGFYRVLEGDGTTVDVLAGLRYVKVEQSLDLRLSGSVVGQPLPDRERGGNVEFKNWDAVVGARGRVALGDSGAWFLPWYLDVGSGESDLTWQLAAGVGYALERWDFGLVWRHMDYELPSDNAIADIEFSGPAAVFGYRW